MTRIRWSAREKSALTNAARRILSAKPGTPVHELATEALLVLPPERRRMDRRAISWLRRELAPVERRPNEKNIRWTAEEAASVVAAARSIRRAGPISSTTLFVGAQRKALPAERHRPINSDTVSWLSRALREGTEPISRPGTQAPQERAPAQTGTDVAAAAAALVDKGVDLLVALLRNDRVKVALQEVLAPLVQATVQANAVAPAAAPAQAPAPVEPPVPRAEAAVAPPVAIPIVGEAGAAPVSAETRHEPATQQEPPSVPPTVSPPTRSERRKSRQRKVLIAGLIAPQINEIERSHPRTLKIRYWQQAHTHDRLRALARESEICIGFVNFLSHAADNTLKGHSAKYIRHSGGISALKEMLSKL